MEAVVELRTLSEHESKQVLATRGALFAGEAIVPDPQQAVAAAQRFGFPVVIKLVGERLAHKSERGLVRIGLGDASAVQQAAQPGRQVRVIRSKSSGSARPQGPQLQGLLQAPRQFARCRAGARVIVGPHGTHDGGAGVLGQHQAVKSGLRAA